MKLVAIDDYRDFNELIEQYLAEINHFEQISCDDNNLRAPQWLEYFYQAPTHFGYYIQENNENCGFVLICNQCFLAKDERLFLSEFYIVPKYRRLHLGKQAALEVFKLHPGPWEISVHPRNLVSISFWENILNCISNNTWRVYKGICGVFDNSLANIYHFEL